MESAAAVLLLEVASCAGSVATARSLVEEVAGAPALDLLRFVFLEDDMVVNYAEAVITMCVLYGIE